MDAKSCVIFLKAAETGSITKAALALGYTQAGVSLVVRKIEEECGFHLLIREKNGVRLTDAGARLLPIMREIARWDERFRETAAEINGVSTGTVRVGCYSSIAYHWMPRVIRAFRVNHPKIAIDILEGSVDEIERWIEERRVDVGFLSARRGQRRRIPSSFCCRRSICSARRRPFRFRRSAACLSSSPTIRTPIRS